MSIATKLILASSMMMALAVVLLAWVSVGNISEQAEEQVQKYVERGRRSFRRESSLIATAAAQSLGYPFGNNVWTDVDLDKLLAEHNRPRAVGGEAGAGDGVDAQPEIKWMIAFEKEEEDAAPDLASILARINPDPRNPGILDRNGLPPYIAGEVPTLEAELAAVRDALESERGDEKGAYCTKERRGSWFCAAPITYGRVYRRSVLWMEVSLAQLLRQSQRVRAEYLQREEDYRRNVLLVAAGILLGGVLLAAFQGMRLARPISELTDQAARIAGGDLGRRVPAGRSDELGVLADKFNFMADQIGLLLIEQAKKATLEHEMSLARSVQQSMLPPHSLESFAHLKVVGYCAPASSCGGDWWMYRKLSGGRMLIVVGDATGHGIHSAMIAATARGAVEALAALDEKLLVPEQVLRAIDSAIRNVGEHHVLMTAFAAVADSTTGGLQYANAGQNFPYIVRCKDGVLGEATILASSGNPLGDREIPLEIRGGTRELHAGDVFVCFTDGLVERANPAGALFGDRRLLKTMRSQSVESDAALVALRERVVSEVERHAEGEVAGDDVTFVMCQYDPLAAPSAHLQSTGTG